MLERALGRTETLVKKQKATNQVEEVINDFSIQVATVNGSGSQSSNNVLMRSIFQMGIPISGKNLFPSNIAGLPTWFTIRASKEGYVARKKEIDILIAMNPQTAREDVEGLESGSVVIFEENLRLSRLREDLCFYPVPFSRLAAEVVKDFRLRKLVANMVYVGSAAQILNIDLEEVKAAIGKWFQSKTKAIEFNVKAARLGAEYVEENLDKQDPFRVERMEATRGKILIDGNAAAALGCVFGGFTVATWYPITPSSSLCEAIIDYAGRFRVDKETGKATFAVVQAEDELAALGMAIGAGWAGSRAMTSTSGPGISLMSEFAGLAYFAEVPCVIFDIQRVGPSTGLPTRTSQGDINLLYHNSHGDTKHLVLFPATMKECFEFAQMSFDLAERFQQPVFIASDLDLAMNNWMTAPFEHPASPFDRGKVLTAEDLDRLGEFGRYKDVDGDGITYRTLPGTKHDLAAYLTRGSGHNESARYSERPEDFTYLLDRLARKYKTAKAHVPAPVVDRVEGSRLGLIAYGSTDAAVQECRDQLSMGYGTEVSYLRLRALPLTDEVTEFISAHEEVFVVEQNRDGQVAEIIRLAAGAEIVKVKSVLHYNGMPIDARFITDQVAAMARLERTS